MTEFVKRFASVSGAAAVAAALLAAAPLAPSAVAVPCPDVQVVFARGTTEPPGVGGIGQAFVDSLQSRLGARSVDVYPVTYPASTDFPTAAQGVADASNHVRQMATTCPSTKMVLGGYSQGAAVIGYVTAAAIPAGYALPADIIGPMPSDVAKHVAAVALFGQPSNRFLTAIDAPPISLGPLYAPKTIDQCVVDDPICTNDGGNLGAHGQYLTNGMVDQAAVFAAQRL